MVLQDPYLDNSIAMDANKSVNISNFQPPPFNQIGGDSVSYLDSHEGSNQKSNTKRQTSPP